MVKRSSFADMPCPVARSLDVVGQWWSLLIVRNAFYGHTRFREFQENLGISKNMLAARLLELTEQGILDKIPDRGGSKYPEYILTDKGKELIPVLIAFLDWGNKWAAPDEGPLLHMVDKRDGSLIPPQRIIGKDGKPVPYEALGTRKGSGAANIRKKTSGG